VIDAHAIMGQITEVTPFRAKVIMITDPMHAIPVRVLRSGLLTVAKGTGRVDSLELPFLPNSADISVGDLLISSGLGGRYPADYPVARVTQIDQDSSTGAPVVYAMPLAKLAQSRDVMLVWQIDQRGTASMDADEGAQDGESLLDPLKLSLPDKYNSEESD
jgi:rod shape-determining protein MreC